MRQARERRSGARAARCGFAAAMLLALGWPGAAAPIAAARDADPRGTALACGDFDEDGVLDVALLFATGRSGAVALARGNLDALYPNGPEAARRRAEGAYVDAAFFEPSPAAAIAEAPDFAVGGDFDGDGHCDVAVASRGSRALRLLCGDGRGAFSEGPSLRLPAPPVGMVAGEIGDPDGARDIAVEVDDGVERRVVALASPQGAIHAAPARIAPSPGEEAGGPGSVERFRAAFAEARVALRPARELADAGERGEASARATGPALALRLNADAIPDLVRWNAARTAPEIELSTPAATFTVINTADGGPGSFRQALVDANASPGADAIVFAIPGAGAHTIVPLVEYPTITDPVTIDATSQPGFAGSPLVELDGASAGNVNCFTITSGRCTIRGLAIDRFQRQGIELRIRESNVIEGNYIGTDTTGTVARGNGYSAIYMCESDLNTLGGTTPEARNVLSGNGLSGIGIVSIGSNDNLVEGNYIGTNAAGTAAIPNAGQGILVDTSSGTTIGGSAPGARNVISGNALSGVEIRDDRAAGTVVVGNYIGTNAAGTAAVGNGASGVLVDGSKPVAVGGEAAGAGNVISGNAGTGVVFSGPTAAASSAKRNRIGVAAASADAVGNGNYGVYVNADRCAVGSASGAGNVVGHNGLDGVFVAGGVGSSILGNAIFENGELGIDLAFNGVTPNDTGDADGGPNDRQNFPVLASAVTSNGATVVRGTVGGSPADTFRVELFASPACDPSGYGEGALYLGFVAVPGGSQFEASVPVVAAGSFVSATATAPNGDTSEFSACVASVSTGAADLSVAANAEPNPVPSGSQTEVTVVARNAGPDAADGVAVSIAVPEGATFVSASADGGACSPPGDSGVLVCTFARLESGQSVTVRAVFAVAAATGGTVAFVASIASGTGDPNAANDTDRVDVSIGPAVTPPTISSVASLVKPGKPYRVKITGTNFEPGARVYVGDAAEPWPNVKQKGSTMLVLLKGAAVRAAFPAGVATRVRVVNPDGGSATAEFTR